MFSGFSDFLKDTFTENVKGLLKPSNWFVAAIFLFLNILFIFPVLIDQNVLIPTNIFGTSSSLQFAAAIVVVLVLAYSLSSMKQAIFRLMTGDLWKDSPVLGSFLKNSEQKLSRDVEKQQQHNEEKQRQLHAKVEAVENKGTEQILETLSKPPPELVAQKTSDPSSKDSNPLQTSNTATNNSKATITVPNSSQENTGQSVPKENAEQLDSQDYKSKNEHLTDSNKLRTGNTVKDSSKESTIDQSSLQENKKFPDAQENAEQPVSQNDMGKDEDLYEYVGPTALGRAIRKHEKQIQKRWGITVKCLWPYMESAIADEKDLNRIHSEQDTLEFFINLTVILLLFAIEQMFVQFIWPQERTVLWLLISLVLAYIFYRMAVSQAHIVGEAKLLVFTRHRDKLREELHLREFSDEEEKQTWESISKYLANLVKQPNMSAPDNILSGEPITEIINSDIVTVKLLSGTTNLREPEKKDNGFSIQRDYQYIDYVMIVSNTKDEKEAKDIHIVVFDPQVPIVAEEPHAINLSEKEISAKILTANSADAQFATTVIPRGPAYQIHQLLWYIDKLDPNCSAAFRYKLPSRFFKSTIKATVKDKDKETTEGHGLELKVLDSVNHQYSYTQQVNYFFTITNPENNVDVSNITLEVLDSRRDFRKLDPNSGIVFKKTDKTTNTKLDQKTSTKDILTLKQDRYIWDLGDLSSNQEIMLQYTV